MTLRARPFRKLAGVRTIRRERQRHRRRQFHDGIGGLCRADAKAADNDGDHRHFRSPRAVGFGRIDREWLQSVGDHRNHAVAGFFEQPRIDPAHDRRKRRRSFGLVRCCRRALSGRRDARRWSRRSWSRSCWLPDAACLGADIAVFAVGSDELASAGFSPARSCGIAVRTIGSPPNGLLLKIAKPAKVARNRPSSTASACIAVKGSRNRRLARTVSCPSGALRSSAASAMDLPESDRAKIARPANSAANRRFWQFG